ncbi:MAG: hypothetical protein Q7S15_01195 [bacterium]|nr:hypothetical protein [bacterium]
MHNKFRIPLEPALVRTDDLLASEDGMHWKIIERLTCFAIFVLKSELTGKKVLAAARQEPDRSWVLREIRNPEQIRVENRFAKRTSRIRRRSIAA